MLLRRTGAPLVAIVACACLVLSTVPAVGDPDVPSRRDVAAARAQATSKARDVGVIKARMLLADQRLQDAALLAEQASEAYNGAMWRLDQARADYRTARADAVRARYTVGRQRTRIGALVAHSYQQGGELSALHAVLTSKGPEGVLDQYAAFAGASSSLQADYQRFAASDSLARVYEDTAATARAKQAALAAEAEQAQARAQGAAEAAQSAAAHIAVEQVRLVRELARAQNVSVALARSRQQALQEIARRRAEARARRAAVTAAAAAAEAVPRTAAAPSRRPARKPVVKPVRRPEKSSNPAPNPVPNPAPNPAPKPAPKPAPRPAPPTPAPAPPPPPAPSSGGGGQQAIRYAMAQLGEPYQWGAAGPGSWDCSGLTMMAWGSAGRSLPHYSVAQYEASTPISVSSLRPGDLVFWSSNGSPSGIHHVALYIGGGQILHAPRTGRPVAIDDMYYWVPPNFFGRV